MHALFLCVRPFVCVCVCVCLFLYWGSLLVTQYLSTTKEQELSAAACLERMAVEAAVGCEATRSMVPRRGRYVSPC